jgi:hypothetical protein
MSLIWASSKVIFRQTSKGDIPKTFVTNKTNLRGNFELDSNLILSHLRRHLRFKKLLKKTRSSYLLLQFSSFCIIFLCQAPDKPNKYFKSAFVLTFCFQRSKTRKKTKILKWSVLEAQAKAISSTSLRDTVSTYSASESTRLDYQWTREFFEILLRGLLGTMSTFHF